TSGPVRGAADRPAARIGHYDEAWQAVVERAQAVTEPGAHARLADLHAAGVHLQTARGVGGRIGVHRPDDTQVVRVTGDVGVEAADFQPAAAVPAEGERRLHQVADGPAVGADRGVAAVIRPVEARQGRFVVEGIDVTGGAVHEQE